MTLKIVYKSTSLYTGFIHFQHIKISLWLSYDFKDVFPIFKDLITLQKCLELVTERPKETRKLSEFFKQTIKFMIFYDFLSIFENFNFKFHIFKDVRNLLYLYAGFFFSLSSNDYVMSSTRSSQAWRINTDGNTTM